jgi:type IV pilus assembly protein PilO
MPGEPFWTALWRLNRTLPLMVGGLLLLNLIAAGIAFWYVAPDLSAVNSRFLQQQQTYREARKSGDIGHSPQAIFRQDLLDLQTLVGTIPNLADFTGLVSDLFAMAGHAGLTIDHVSYDPSPVKDEDLLSYSLAFSVTGNYGQVKKFIYLLEHSPRLLAIEGLTLNTSRERTPGQINLGLQLTTYFRKPAP